MYEIPVPDTLLPETPGPDTQVADTSVPDTPVPDILEPDTPVPDTPVPYTPVLDAPVADTPVPEVGEVLPPQLTLQFLQGGAGADLLTRWPIEHLLNLQNKVYKHLSH